METFEEYWETTPKFGGLNNIPVVLAEKVAAACYVAGQSAGMKEARDLYDSILGQKEIITNKEVK